MHALTLTADAKSIMLSTETHWVGSSEDENEIRTASESGPVLAMRWTYLRENHSVVTSRQQLRQFVRAGGHALVESKLLGGWWKNVAARVECYRHYETMPYVSADRPPPYERQRFARGALRQAVMLRDEGRCRMCGRSPDDALDVQLDLHHVVLHGAGGMTVEHNLIVLCQTCHDATDYFEEHTQHLLQDKISIAAARFHRVRHADGVSHYRRHMARRFPRRAAEFLPAVLPLEWDAEHVGEPNPASKLFYEQLCCNAVVQWFAPADWYRLLGPSLR